MVEHLSKQQKSLELNMSEYAIGKADGRICESSFKFIFLSKSISRFQQQNHYSGRPFLIRLIRFES